MKKKLVVVTAVAVFLALVGYLVLPGLLVNGPRNRKERLPVCNKRQFVSGTMRLRTSRGARREGPHGPWLCSQQRQLAPFGQIDISPAYHVVALDLPGFGGGPVCAWMGSSLLLTHS